MASSDSQTDVTILGLGAMGAALASTFLRAGKGVTVWNRSSARAAPLVREGAILASDVEAAVAASPVTVMIVLDHPAVLEILSDRVLATMANKTLVDLTTATSSELQQLAEIARNAGIRFIAGGVTVYPRSIGDENTTIFYSGDALAFRESEKLLRTLAGSQKFVGSDPAVGQAIYLATAGACFSAVPGIFEAVAWGERYGISTTQMFEYVRSVSLPYLHEVVQDYSLRLANGNFSGEHGTVDTFSYGLEAAVVEMEKIKINSRSFTMLKDYLRAAQDNGLGKSDFSSLYSIITEPK